MSLSLTREAFDKPFAIALAMFPAPINNIFFKITPSQCLNSNINYFTT
jgi:hypothetical protein